MVETSTNICMKSYKKKLCLKLSVQSYESCLFQRFGVFEVNGKFCVSNTKCVPKTVTCHGSIINNTFL